MCNVTDNVTPAARRRGVYFIVVINVKGGEDSCTQRNNHSRGVDSRWQTERRDVPGLLNLHLLCVCYFSNCLNNYTTKHMCIEASLKVAHRDI